MMTRAHARMKLTTNAREYRLARMFEHDIWEFDVYTRRARQYTDWAAHASWKQNRRAQYKGSARV